MIRSRIAIALAAFAALGLAGLPVQAQNTIVINEIDYDQPGSDTAEFIELKNVSGAAIDLDTYSVELFNGATNTVYLTIDLPAVMLAAGDYYVICGNNATTANCDLDVTPNTDLVQNGAPDAMALRDGTTVVDAVSYEGTVMAPYSEGSGVLLIDSGAGANVGISRFPDGTDTQQNDVDLTPRCITPGQANIEANAMCATPVAVQPTPWTNVKRLFN
jgi:predicted extracellular nuclease